MVKGVIGWIVFGLIRRVGLPAAFLALVVFMSFVVARVTASEFERIYVDTAYGGDGKPGWVLAGDMDNDCDLDIVAGGGYALFIYENNGLGGIWTRYGNLDPTGEIGSNGAVLFDVDGDYDLDVVAARYESELGWWENPGGPLRQASWTFHRLAGGQSGWFLHDLIVTDLDGDGVAEEFVAVLQNGYWDAPFHVAWYRRGSDPYADWLSFFVTENQPGPSNNHAGIDAADIDGDGDIDLAFSNGWFESSGQPESAWTWHAVADVYGVSNALARDVDGDRDMDLVISAGHHGQGVYWFENNGGAQQIDWVRHDISGVEGDVTRRHYYGDETPEHVHHPEGLEVTDLDGDFDLDVIASELFFGEDNGEPAWSETVHNLYVFENLGGSPIVWRRQNLAPNSYPSHLLRVVDINGDCAPDIISEAAAMSVVSYYRNKGEPVYDPRNGSAPSWHQDGVPSGCPDADCLLTIPACGSWGLVVLIVGILSCATLIVRRAAIPRPRSS